MIHLSFTQIKGRLDQLVLPQVDFVVGIADGGVAPACMVSYKINVNMGTLRINYRDQSNAPKYEEPRIMGDCAIHDDAQSILLVDDVSVSGKTLRIAKSFFQGRKVSTLVLKGSADYVLFPEIKPCVKWPWKNDSVINEEVT